jgi:hypothetical protein
MHSDMRREKYCIDYSHVLYLHSYSLHAHAKKCKCGIVVIKFNPEFSTSAVNQDPSMLSFGSESALE